MLSLKECFDFCGLTGDEVHAIAEHAHLSDISAAALGQALLQTEEGISEIKRFMREDIENAKLRGHPDAAQELEQVLAHFKETHRSSSDVIAPGHDADERLEGPLRPLRASGRVKEVSAAAARKGPLPMIDRGPGYERMVQPPPS